MPTKPTPAPGPAEHLIQRLTTPEAQSYLGQTAIVRLQVWAALESGEGTLAAIAREHHLSRAAMTYHAKAAAVAFGLAPRRSGRAKLKAV